MMYHTTTMDCVPSILRYGLLRKLCPFRLKRVWLHDRQRAAWAALHVIAKRKCRLDEVVILTVDTRGMRLGRFHRPGLMHSGQDVPPWRILKVRRAADLKDIRD